MKLKKKQSKRLNKEEGLLLKYYYLYSWFDLYREERQDSRKGVSELEKSRKKLKLVLAYERKKEEEI